MIPVISPAFFKNDSLIQYLVKSAERHGIDLRLYGMGETYKGWIDTHITRALQAVSALDSELVMFVDAADVIFLAGPEEIERHYRRQDADIVMAKEHSGLNFGGWVGRRDVALSMLSRLAEFMPEEGDPQVRMRQYHASCYSGVVPDEGWIFNVESPYSRLKCVNGRITDLWDTRQPCVIHFAGGYFSPTEGRYERMKPYWEGLGYGI